MAARFMRLGGYTPSEVHVVMHAANYKPSMNGRAVIYCHGLGGNGFIDGADIRTDCTQLSDRGFVIAAPLLGGGTTWGNVTSAGSTVAVDGTLTTGAVDAALTYLNASYGANVDRVLFLADSHGASIALNWAVRNPSRLGGAILRVPAFSLQSMHDSNAAGCAAGMETAYTNLATLQAAYPKRDGGHATFRSLVVSSGIVSRLRSMYNAADPIVAAADVTAFGTATGVETINMGGPSHAPWGYFDIHDQYLWLKSKT